MFAIDIECDGSQHEIIDGIPIAEDVRRDEFLEQQGWEVVRIPNCRIQTSLAQVGNEIVDHVTMRERSNE